MMTARMAGCSWRQFRCSHHSFGAGDSNKPVTLTGTVTKSSGPIPICFFLDVKDDKGNVANWKFEGYPPSVLSRDRLEARRLVKVGDTVSVFGWRSRDGTNWAHSREVTFADGKAFFGPPAGTGDPGNTPAVHIE